MGVDVNTLVGRTLAKKYRLVRSIGAGGMGVVFEAIHVDLHRRVALKVLLEDDARALARFGQEALATSKLDSPHIVKVSDFHARVGSPPFIVMELLDGESLRDAMRRVHPVPYGVAVKVAVQLLSALGTAHRAGIVHRDVKPANVFLERSTSGETNVKLLDFGIAKLAAEAGGMKTTAGAILGTPAYLAPEQITGGAVDGRTDLHAVGVLLYEMLLGKRPWDGRQGAELGLAIVNEPAPPILREEIPAALGAIITRALAKDPAERFADANAMGESLLAFLQADSTGETRAQESLLPARAPSLLMADAHDTVRDPPVETEAPVSTARSIVRVSILALVVTSSVLVMRSEEETGRASDDVMRALPNVGMVPPVATAWEADATAADTGIALSSAPPSTSRLSSSPRAVTPQRAPPRTPPRTPSVTPSVPPSVTPSVTPSVSPPRPQPEQCDPFGMRDPFTGKCEHRP